MKFPIRHSSLTLLAGALLCAAGASAGPMSGEAVQTRTEKVKYAPSQVATQQGASALYAELKTAAQHVCTDPDPAQMRYEAEAAFQACVEEALTTAVRKIGIPMLTVLHQYGSEGRAPAMASR